jgi:hypothetical protein
MKIKIDEKLTGVLNKINPPKYIESIEDESQLYNTIRGKIFAKDDEMKRYRFLEKNFDENTINEFVERVLDNILKIDNGMDFYQFSKNNEFSLETLLTTQSIKTISQYRLNKFFPKNEINEAKKFYETRQYQIHQLILKNIKEKDNISINQIENAFDRDFYDGKTKKQMIGDYNQSNNYKFSDMLDSKLINFELLKYDKLEEILERMQRDYDSIKDPAVEILNQSASIGSLLKSDFELLNGIKTDEYFMKYNEEPLQSKLK